MDDDWGGPLAQADFAGSGVGIFGAVAVEDLLILQRDMREERKEKKRNVRIVAKIMNFYFFVDSCGLVVKNDLPAGENAAGRWKPEE